MYQQDYYVPKSTGTLADSLLAYGTATTLHRLLQGVPGRAAHARCPVSIEDKDVYVIHLPEPVRPEWLESSHIDKDLAMAVRREAKPKDDSTAEAPSATKMKKNSLNEDLPTLDYNKIWDEIRAANALMQEQRKQGGSGKREEIQEQRSSMLTIPHRDVALLIGDYRMQVEGIHNQLVRQWYDTTAAGCQAANLRAILRLFATASANSDEIIKDWTAEVKPLMGLDGFKSRVAASQVYNPSMGKGQNRPKADKLAMGNQDSFWLIEYLKAVGLFVASAPRAFTDEGMRKTYVLAPANIEIGEHTSIFRQFERTLDGLGVSPIKADVLTSLDYASTYLSYWVEAKREDGALAPNPRHSIAGFYVASYKLLSQNSFTMLNLSFLGLPPWLHHVATQDDVVAVQEVIAEQRKLIIPLQEKHQEGITLLDRYRDFLTGHRLNAFFEFCARYGEYVVHTLPERRFTQQYSVKSLNEIFRRVTMSDNGQNNANDLTEFISTSGQHPGFHRLAYAIRHSTVIPQRQNANYKSGQRAEKSLYDVRYGLAKALRNKTNSAGEFMNELAEFLQLYNNETTQEYENTSERRKSDPDYAKGHYRSEVSPTTALDDVLELVKKYGPELVCNMLVAYGYARG